MSGLPDYTGDPASFYGSPSKFKIGDRVATKEDDGTFPGWVGEVVGFKLHRCPKREHDFLMPVVKHDRRSFDHELETYYPFSVRLLDPIEAIARLA